jgi:hypothetical protein
MAISILQIISPLIGLYHPLDGITNPKYKLLHFLTTDFFKEKKALASNWDRCFYLALCLRLILLHCHLTNCHPSICHTAECHSTKCNGTIYCL